MIRLFTLFMLVLLFNGCGQDFVSFNSSSDASLDKELLQKQKISDEEVLKLEQEIAKLELDKEKYQQDYEDFDNNAILDELDETLKDDMPADEAVADVKKEEK